MFILELTRLQLTIKAKNQSKKCVCVCVCVCEDCRWFACTRGSGRCSRAYMIHAWVKRAKFSTRGRVKCTKLLLILNFVDEFKIQSRSRTIQWSCSQLSNVSSTPEPCKLEPECQWCIILTCLTMTTSVAWCTHTQVGVSDRGLTCGIVLAGAGSTGVDT